MADEAIQAVADLAERERVLAVDKSFVVQAPAGSSVH